MNIYQYYNNLIINDRLRRLRSSVRLVERKIQHLRYFASVMVEDLGVADLSQIKYLPISSENMEAIIKIG